MTTTSWSSAPATRGSSPLGWPPARDIAVTLVNERDRFVERVRLHQLAAGQDLRDGRWPS